MPNYRPVMVEKPSTPPTAVQVSLYRPPLGDIHAHTRPAVHLYEYQDEHGQWHKVAIKFIINSNVNSLIRREVVNHWNLSHPNIVRFKEVFATNTHLAIAMEFMPGGNLAELVASQNGLSEPLARHLFQQIIYAVKHCHDEEIPHRDIKLDNVVLNQQGLEWGVEYDPETQLGKVRRGSFNLNNMHTIKAKLCDLGSSKRVNVHGLPVTAVGTDAYMAPEVLNRRNGAPQAGQTYNAEKSDVWSCGVLLYLMLMAYFPFGDRNQPAQYEANIHRGAYVPIPPAKNLSGPCLDLIRQMLTVDINQRISMEGIINHPWLTQEDPIPRTQTREQIEQLITNIANLVLFNAQPR